MSSKDLHAVPAPAKTGPSATFVVSRRGIIEDVDEAACELLGYSRDDLLGLHGSELVPTRARPATAASIDLMRRGEISRREARLLHKNGTEVDVEVNGSPHSDGRITLRLRKR
jgi:PAS domain S-box-containing protein